MARYDDYDDDDDMDITRGRDSSGYASFGLRFAAAFIDGLILFIPNAIIQLGIPIALDTSSAPPWIGVVLVNVLSTLMYWLYEAVQESGPAQATIGKRAVGIIVTDLDGRPISFGRATGRHFGKIPSTCICFAGFIMAAFTERKQALHDMLAGTLVVRR